MESLPVVDLSRVTRTAFSDEDFHSVSQEVGKALKEVGFVYLINHGIPTEKVESAFRESNHFFELPLETKKKYTRKWTVHDLKEYHGFAPTSEATPYSNVLYELREKYDLKPGCLRFPDEECPGFGSSLIALENECRPLIIKLLRMLAHSLGQKDLDVFVKGTKCVDNPVDVPSFTSLSSIYYPKIKEELTILPGMVRCREHTDWGSITLLFQDTMGGLEVKRADGKWIPATPIPGSILINTGQVLEIWSNGLFRATFHRVLIPEAEIKRRSHRQSLAYFVFPDDDTIITPLQLVSESESGELSDYFKTMIGLSAYEFAKRKVEREVGY